VKKVSYVKVRSLTWQKAIQNEQGQKKGQGIRENSPCLFSFKKTEEKRFEIK
jgi:hypothetical protein